MRCEGIRRKREATKIIKNKTLYGLATHANVQNSRVCMDDVRTAHTLHLTYFMKKKEAKV